jgi:hypothetical protein
MDNMTMLLNGTHRSSRASSNHRTSVCYAQTEQEIFDLLSQQNSDSVMFQPIDSEKLQTLEQEVYEAVLKAFEPALHDNHKRTAGSHLALRFLQRILYRINQFSAIHPEQHTNQPEPQRAYFYQWRDRIEQVWQQWELTWLDVKTMPANEVLQALSKRVKRDLNPPLSEHRRFIQEQVSRVGYQRLAAIAAARRFAEATQSSVSNSLRELHEFSADQFACLQQIEGNQTNRQYLPYLSEMLAALNLDSDPETHFDLVPWAALATVNQFFLFHRNPLYWRRYIGATLHNRIATAIATRHYEIAAKRLELPPAVAACWNAYQSDKNNLLEEQLEQFIQPILEYSPDDAWELILGYDQQHYMNYRAQAAIARSLREAERANRRVPQSHMSDSF